MRIIIEIDAENKAEVKKEGSQHSNELAQASSSSANDAGGAKVDGLNDDSSSGNNSMNDVSVGRANSASKAIDAGSSNVMGGNEQREINESDDGSTPNAETQNNKTNAGKGNDAGAAKAVTNGDEDTSVDDNNSVLSDADKANAIDGGGFNAADAEVVS